MTQIHQNSLYLYDYSIQQVDQLPWQHLRRRVTPEESRRVDLAKPVISGILQNKEKS
jgi:hypothetical protein